MELFFRGGWDCRNFDFFVLENTLLGVYITQIPWEGGWDTSVGWSSSIKSNSGILSEKLLACKAGRKNSTKLDFGKFTSIEKLTQLLLIEHIGGIQKLNKLSYYQITIKFVSKNQVIVVFFHTSNCTLLSWILKSLW